jgi:hypothetical protein
VKEKEIPLKGPTIEPDTARYPFNNLTSTERTASVNNRIPAVPLQKKLTGQQDLKYGVKQHIRVP